MNSHWRERERMAENELAAKPNEPKALYSRAIARLMLGARLSSLNDLVALVNACFRKDAALSRFCADAAAQLAELCLFVYKKDYFHLEASDAAAIADFARVGVNAVSLLAEKSGDNALAPRVNAVKTSLRSPKPVAGREARKFEFFTLNSPLSLQIEPTNLCNLKCPMCSRRLMTRPIGRMSQETLKRVMSTWSEASRKISLTHLLTKDKLWLTSQGKIKFFFMGEPLIHPQLNQLIGIIREYGALVGIQTNGALLASPVVRRRLLERPPDNVAISLDGVDPESFAKIRNGAAWERCLGAIIAFRREASARGVDKKMDISVTTIAPAGDSLTREKAEAFLEPVKPYVDRVNFITLNASSDPEFIDSDGNLKTYKTSVLEKNSVVRNAICSEPFYKLNVFQDGTIAPCCNDFDGKMILGHAREGVDNVWNGEPAKRLRRALLNGKTQRYALCEKCLYGVG